MNRNHSTTRSILDRALMTFATLSIVAVLSPSVNAQSGTKASPPARSQVSQTPQSGSGSKTTQSGSSSKTTQSGSSAKQSGSSAKSEGSGMKAAMAPVGLDGYCPVCIIKVKKWVKGTSQFAAEYDGKTYLFPDAATKQTFMENPSQYAPILGGDCSVALVEMGKRVPGSVEHAALHDGHLYLFGSEEGKNMFRTSKEKYAKADVAFDGKCSVCLVEMNKQVDGMRKFTTTFHGKRYMFPSSEQQKMFQQNPSKYEDK